jgi:Glycosyltransferase
MLTIVYPKISVPSGNKSYANRILKGLEKRNYKFRSVGIRKIEFSIGGKPMGGIISQNIQLRLHRFKDHPIHALVPEVAPRNCDVVTVHDVIPLKKNDSFISSVYDRKAYEIMYRNAINSRILISSTNVGVKEIEEGLGVSRDRIMVVYESIDHDIFYPDKKDPYPNDGKYHLITVGDFNPRKRFDILFEIFGGREDITLYHIGPINSWRAYYERSKKIAEKFSNIKILGPKDSATLRRYLSNAHLFVYYSEAEGFGLTPIEALATGTNVLVNPLDVFRETIGDVAFFSDKDNFLETAYKAIDNPRKPEYLVEYSMKYSLEREISDLIKIYESLST